MTQELIDLRNSILSGRYDDALAIVDELEGMSKKSTLRNIRSYLIRMLIHLIKNQVEQRLTNSWAVSIRDSLVEIQDLNIMDNKKSHYVKADEWEELLYLGFDAAIYKASVEVSNGEYKPVQLLEVVDKEEILEKANQLLSLTYNNSPDTFGSAINSELSKLVGGADWNTVE
ncbi:MAG: DUF29 family protein [Hormoscilla sp. GM7CHS1pb]|nr:DUF29 family protein [Hormoscilla sp. GM7CHS1pb]